MAIYFETPTAPLVPAAVNPEHPGFPLFRHYRPWDAGINLFVVNGQVTTVEPDYEFVTPERVYLGGHIYKITQAEADLLTAAGFTVAGRPWLPQPGQYGYGPYGAGKYGGGVEPTAPLPGFEDVTGDTVLGAGEYGWGDYGDDEYGGAVLVGAVYDTSTALYDTAKYDDATFVVPGSGGLPGFEDVYGDVPDGQYTDEYQESYT